MAISAREIVEQNILRFWLDKMLDPNGGFYGRIDGHNRLHPEAERGAVMMARVLWAFSAAYHVLGKEEYLAAAKHAKAYIEAHFLDKEFGGAFWSVNADGTALDTKKQTYALGFMIYGFSEYARATGDEQAKTQATELFNSVEKHCNVQKDDVQCTKSNAGYIEALTRDWQPIADMRLSDKDENGSRTMNTHLHILEPYTNLYRIWQSPLLADRIRTLIHIFTKHLYNPKSGHLDLFFDDNWQGKRDIESYGHDIEAAWLMTEALEVLGDKALTEETMPFIRRIAAASLDGLLPNGAMIHEKNIRTGETDSQIQWWVPCEAVIGFIDQYQHTGEEHWLEKAEKQYQFILDKLIDYENGEWYWNSGTQTGHAAYDEDKAGFWKCPYHNSRMCFEIIERTAAQMTK